jgi:hypothetical protein
MARSRRPSLLVLSMLALWLSTGAGRPAFIVDQLVQSVLASVLLALLLGRARWPRGAGDSAFASRAGKGSQETGGHGGWGKRVGSGAETA